MKYLLLALIVCARLASAIPAGRCGGGDDGPKPLADFSDIFHADVKDVPTQGAVEEFLYLEHEQSIVYRNTKRDIHKLSSLGSTPLTQSGQPLSRLTDEKNRYLASDAAPWVFDMKKGIWYNYQIDARPFRHLFFHGSSLYSISSRIGPDNTQYMNVYEYKVGDTAAHRICRTIEAPAGQHYILAEGHSYPEVYLYRMRPTTQGCFFVTFYSMDIGFLCGISGLGHYTREIAGEAKSAHMFRDLKSLAVEVDHPTNNLLWDTKEGEGWRYYDINGLKPYVLNFKKPVIATWDQKEGMSLIYLDAAKKTKVNKVMQTYGYGPIEELLPQDVWMPNIGNRLLISPLFETGTRWMLDLTLGNTP